MVFHGVSLVKEIAPAATSALPGQEDKVSILLSTVKCIHFSMLTLTFKEKEELLQPQIIPLLEDHIITIG